MFGKTKHMSWAITSSLTDLSDLYREKISDDGKKYMVDGQWKDLKFIKEQIYVKGQEKPVEFVIRETTRGPLMDMDLLQGAEVLFSEGLPSGNDGTVFSFAWSGAINEEGTTKVLGDFIKATKI
jgi:acyl-homoserine lactone acylase PvdQ